jgi:L-gulonolactone oxidase
MTAHFVEREFQSWGGVTRMRYATASPAFRDELHALITRPPRLTTLAVGLGRSYGDTCLNSGGALIDMRRLDRIIAADFDAGIVLAEAGMSLDALLRLIVPKGWFLPTTPGTRFVTLGGAVANDVHGKNHHVAGSFGCSVRRLQLIRSDGVPRDLAAADASPLFCATVGGLGLTGIISAVEIKLAPISSAYLDVERIPFHNIRDFFRLSAGSSHVFEQVVSWVDCSDRSSKPGRGIFQRARWCADRDLTPHSPGALLAVPNGVPRLVPRGFLLKMLNALYYRLNVAGPSLQRLHYSSFFYPLDRALHWNRLYGSRGFYQYQCLIPSDVAPAAVEELLTQVARAGGGSCLAVLKTLGPIASPGLISFASEGTTLALDFPNVGETTLALLERLDAVVGEAGGRLYPAKDGRMSAQMFRLGYPRWAEFAEHVDPRISSNFWRRVAA